MAAMKFSAVRNPKDRPRLDGVRRSFCHCAFPIRAAFPVNWRVGIHDFTLEDRLPRGCTFSRAHRKREGNEVVPAIHVIGWSVGGIDSEAVAPGRGSALGEKSCLVSRR